MLGEAGWAVQSLREVATEIKIETTETMQLWTDEKNR